MGWIERGGGVECEECGVYSGSGEGVEWRSGEESGV